MAGFLAWLSARNKALMALIAGVLNWGYFVVDSPSKAVTAKEWLLLAGVGATAVGVHQISNPPAIDLSPIVARLKEAADSLKPRTGPVPSPTTTSAPPGAVVGTKADG